MMHISIVLLQVGEVVIDMQPELGTAVWFREVVLPWVAPSLSFITAVIAWRIAYLQQNLGARLKREYYKYELFHRYRTQAYKNLNTTLMASMSLLQGLATIPSDQQLTEYSSEKHYETYRKLYKTFNADSTYIADTDLLELTDYIIKAIEHVYKFHDSRIVIHPHDELRDAPQNLDEIPRWINSVILPKGDGASKILKEYFDFTD